MNPKQSWPSALVDTVIVASVVALCFVPNVSPMAWNVLGQIALVRFGVAVTKQAFGGNGNGNGTGSNGPSSNGSKKKEEEPTSADMRRSVLSFAMPAIAVALATLVYSCR